MKVACFAVIAFAIAALGGCASIPSDPNAAPAAPAAAAPQRSSDPLIALLAKGGYVLYLRHGKTDSAFQDKPEKPEWWRTCDTRWHRPLSDEGRKQMESIGANLRALRIPIAKVVTSEYCRAIDSGLLLQVMPIVQDAALNHAEAQRYVKRTDAELVAGLRRLFSEQPPPGRNTVLVGHVISAHYELDKEFASMLEGDVVVMRPLGEGRFEVAGRLAVERWGLRQEQ